MSFASQNEEKQFNKWLKDSPFNNASQALFGEKFKPKTDTLIDMFRQEREHINKKQFLPFETVYKDSFLAHLPETLSTPQKEFIEIVKWRFIVGKIGAMNKLLKKSHDLMDNGKTQESLALVQELADAGHPEACYLYAAYLLQGQYISQDGIQARIYAEKAIEFVEHPRACLILAGIHYESIGVEYNRRTAMDYIRNAERHGENDPSVYAILATYYQDGYIVGRDVERAAHFAHLAK